MSDGNPTPLSPEQVIRNKDYREMTDYLRGSYYPSAGEIVVKHKKSKTYWRAVYAVRDDDSDFCLSATWTQVMPKKITIIKYETISNNFK